MLIVRPQSPAEAYEYLTRTLGQMSFFDANGYDLALPSHPDFDADGEVGSLEQFSRDVYSPEVFRSAMETLGAKEALLKHALQWFARLPEDESFYVPDQYTVVLTLYGPGGSYDPQSGTITMLTTPKGEFRGGGGAYTIVHEMMHIAVEVALVQRFGLSHWQKERLVDALTQRELGHLLPDYQLQSQGDSRIDEAIADVPLPELAAALAAFKSAD
ncbi:MAG: hypothetical protein AAGA23_00410 [Pseudomonadota bacterium]